MDIPAGTWAEEQICQAMAALAPDQQGFIVDVKVNPETSHTYVLFEWRKGVPVCFQGASVKLTDDVEVRLVQPSTPRGDHANAPVTRPTTSGDEIPDATPTSIAGFPPATFFTTMGKLVETLAQNSAASANYGYRKLGVCSGKVPVPAGEEDFDTWIDQAVQAVEEWEVADTVKRQRLIESLRGPASDVVRNLKRDKPGCTAAEYLEALQEIFGGVEDCAELIHRFSHTYQKEGEELSTYVWRLDKILHQVILKRGMEPSRASKALMDQIFKGALPLDPIMLKFHTRYQSKRLTYSKLVKAIREEEALIEAKKIANASHAVFTAEVETLGVADIQTEVMALKTLMSKMIELMTLLSSRIAVPEEGEAVRSIPAGEPSGSLICYNCGGVGHYRRDCPSPPKPRRGQTFLADIRMTRAAVVPNKGFSNEAQEENVPTHSRKRCFGCREKGHFRAQCQKMRPVKRSVKELLKALKEQSPVLQGKNLRGPRLNE
uniref:CCHC-type domain-containing protein n=1 Tax=Leptobrachium leishanense TaxID=445787 RepID=A0A8C5PD86_9ANUR